MILNNVRLILESEIVEDGFLQYDQDKIIAVGRNDSASNNVKKAKFTIVPGFIDIHVHPMDMELETVKTTLYSQGVTTFLATTLTKELDVLKKELGRYARHIDETLWGIHLEGPFLNPLKAGGQDASNIVRADNAVFLDLFQAAKEKIVWMTGAPECMGRAFLQQLPERVKVAAGHTDGDYKTFAYAKSLGINHLTHAFNAMRGVHHRETSFLHKALLDDQFTIEVIADQEHVSLDMLELLYRLKKGKMILVSDQLLGWRNEFDCPVYKNDKGTIIGASQGLNSGFINMLGITSDIVETVKMVSLYPAKLLGIDEQVGSLCKGKTADFLVLNDAFEIQAVYKRGQLVYGGIE